MKNYSSKRGKKGKIAYRTPSQFIYQKYKAVSRWKTGLDSSATRIRAASPKGLSLRVNLFEPEPQSRRPEQSRRIDKRGK